MAGLAVLGTVATEQPSEAALQTTPTARSETVGAKNAVRGPVDHVNQFIKGLNTLHTLPAGEVRKLEETIEKGDIPLSLQINFLEKSLRAGSIHHRELMDPKLSEERFSKIVKIVDAVSTRMTLAYQAKNTDPEVQKYFNIKSIAAATRTISLKETVVNDPKYPNRYSNGFLARAGGDVYFTTVAHGVKATTTEKEYTLGPNDADVAVKYIPQKDWVLWRVNDPAELPEISETTTAESASGSVVVSYSWGPVQKNNTQQEKVHFSFAMPFSTIAQAHVYSPAIIKKFPHIKNTVLFLKPHEEGAVKAKDSQGNARIPALGSSGSVIGTFAGEKYTVLGNLVAVNGINDPCRKMCYAISFGTTPDILRATIKADRDIRIPPATQPPKRNWPTSIDPFNPRRLIDQ